MVVNPWTGITREYCTRSVQVCADKVGVGEDEGGRTTVLTTARLTHPEHAEALCLSDLPQVPLVHSTWCLTKHIKSVGI